MSTSKLLELVAEWEKVIVSRRDDEHALSPATEIDADSIPALSPRSQDSPTHRTAAATLSRPFSPFLLYFTTFIHFSTPPRISTVIAFSARSPVRRCATICHVVIFRRPYTFPHRLCCVCFILFYIYFAFMLQNRLSILFHMLAYILHTNYDTQTSYKNTVELLCKKKEEYIQLCSRFRFYLAFSPSRSYNIVQYRRISPRAVRS